MPRPTLAALLERRYFKEIGVLLLVKTVLIITIRVVFFGHPETRPDPVATTSAHLLGARQTAAGERPAGAYDLPSPSSENRSTHDQ